MITIKSVEHVKRFCKEYPLRHFDAGQSIIEQSETPKCVYFIKSGVVKGHDIDHDGNEQLVWLGTSDDLFPATLIFSINRAPHFFYDAFTEVELYAINKREFSDFLKTHNKALFELAKQLALQQHDLLRLLNAAEKPKAPHKLAYTLYVLALKFGQQRKPKTQVITLPLTHQNFANLLGLTRETVAVELKKLKDDKFIYYDTNSLTVYMDKLHEII